MPINNPYYIGDAIIVRFGFSVLICHPPNLLDKFGEQIWRESPKKLSNLIFLAGGLAHIAYWIGIAMIGYFNQLARIKQRQSPPWRVCTYNMYRLGQRTFLLNFVSTSSSYTEYLLVVI